MRQGIIIVATLVDKLPNLAGLARTCEVRDLGEGVQLEGACLWEGGLCPISAWKPQDGPYLLTVSDHESFDCPAPQVFRASLLVVPDLRVASDPAFSAISVTAEQWVPMAEVTEGALLPWLERKQAQLSAAVGDYLMRCLPARHTAVRLTLASPSPAPPCPPPSPQAPVCPPRGIVSG